MSDFVGRVAEVGVIAEAFIQASESNLSAICGVRGLGGIGKTEVAYAVASRVRSAFPDAQVLVELGGSSKNPLSPEDALKKIIRAFEPVAHLPDDLSSLQGVYRSLLHSKRVLIFADNAAGSNQVAPLVPPAGSALLFTSRLRFSVPGMLPLDIGSLSLEEAINLLIAICPRIGESAPELARLSGCLPLALRVSGSLLKNDATRNVSVYVEQLRDVRARLVGLRDPEDPTLDVEASLQLSFDSLDMRAQETLRQLSVFPSSFESSSAAKVVELQDVEVTTQEGYQHIIRELLSNLYRRSLLEWDATLERYGMHDLVRVFATQQLVDDPRLPYRHAFTYAMVARYAADLYNAGGESTYEGLALFDVERTNIDAGWNWVCSRAQDGVVEAYSFVILYTQALKNIQSVRYHAQRDLIPKLRVALEVAKHFDDRRLEASFLNELGILHTHSSEPQLAINYLESALITARETEDLQAQADALGNLAIAHSHLGHTQVALDFYEQQIEILRASGETMGLEVALGNLGHTYTRVGDAHKAIDYHQQLLESANKSQNFRIKANALLGIGIAYSNLGNANEGIRYFGEALPLLRSIGDQRQESAVLVNLGIAHLDLGELNLSQECLQAALRLTRETGDRRFESLSLLYIGDISGMVGDLMAGIHYQEEALELARTVGDKLIESSILYKLSQNYLDAGNISAAMQAIEEALAFAKEQGDTWGVANYNWQKGHVLVRSGHLQQAIECMDILVSYEREVGHSNYHSHQALLNDLRNRASIRPSD
ncbi:MAG: tetratricopeptide repeat protein [Chloroflexota bacterium]|nr:tetratricopeptide repeat protein [Chloroflexota bacterium]